MLWQALNRLLVMIVLPSTATDGFRTPAGGRSAQFLERSAAVRSRQPDGRSSQTWRAYPMSAPESSIITRWSAHADSRACQRVGRRLWGFPGAAFVSMLGS